MEIDIRAAARLRGSAGAQAAVRPIVEALCGSDADLATVRVVCDWIQYRANFRETAMVRPVLAADDAATGRPGGSTVAEACELAVDLRRCAQPETDVAAEVTAAILDTNPDRVWLEPWAPSSASCVWRFNALFWQALVDWEKATGREYEQTLPGRRVGRQERGRGPRDHPRPVQDLGRAGQQARPARAALRARARRRQRRAGPHLAR